MHWNCSSILYYATTIFRVNIWVLHWGGANVWAVSSSGKEQCLWEESLEEIWLSSHTSLWDAWLFQWFPQWFEDERCQCLPGLLLCVVECNSMFGPQRVFSDCSQPRFLSGIFLSPHGLLFYPEDGSSKHLTNKQDQIPKTHDLHIHHYECLKSQTFTLSWWRI